MGKNKKRNILVWICFVLITVTAWRLYKALTFSSILEGSWDQEIRKQVLTRMDSIMYGFLGAWLYYYKPMAWVQRKNGMFIGGLLILFGSRIFGSMSIEYYKYFYITAQSIGTFLLLPKLNSIIKGKGIAYRVFTFISIISYSMYLLNYTIVLKIIIPGIMTMTGMDYQKNILHAVAGYVSFWGITICLSYLLYRFYELPVMNLRSRFQRKESSGKLV